MDNITSPHDRYFRAAMTDLRVAKDFFQHYLPCDIRDTVDLKSLALCKESYVDEQLKLGITDILYSVEISKQLGFIYLLVEHQSSADYLMPFRILKYTCSIMDHHLNIPKEILY